MNGENAKFGEVRDAWRQKCFHIYDNFKSNKINRFCYGLLPTYFHQTNENVFITEFYQHAVKAEA